jgi:hypothetical protein
MKNHISSTAFVLFFFLFLNMKWSSIEAQTCNPSGKIRGKNAPPKCNQENDSNCCVDDKLYPTYNCSLPVSGCMKAMLTINSFEKGGDGGTPLECGGALNWMVQQWREMFEL